MGLSFQKQGYISIIDLGLPDYASCFQTKLRIAKSAGELEMIVIFSQKLARMIIVPNAKVMQISTIVF